MKVLIVGAHGQIGQLLAERLSSHKDFDPTAMIRNSDQKPVFEKMDVPVLVADLESSVGDLSEKIKDFDAIVFTAGSGGSTGPDKTLLIDLDGAVKIMEVAEQNGIRRYVMVSAIGAHRRERWSEAIRPYFVAKHYADRILRESSLEYTIIRPGALENNPPEGRVTVGEEVERGPVSRSDVAAVIEEVLKNDNTISKSFDVVGGDVAIEEAVSGL